MPLALCTSPCGAAAEAMALPCAGLHGEGTAFWEQLFGSRSGCGEEPEEEELPEAPVCSWV